MLLKASEIRPLIPASTSKLPSSPESSESRVFQKFHLSTLWGSLPSQSRPVQSARARFLLAALSSFSFISWSIGLAQCRIHSLATCNRHSIAGPFTVGSSSAARSCQMGRLSQGANPLLVSPAMKEFKFTHFTNLSLGSSMEEHVSSIELLLSSLELPGSSFRSPASSMESSGSSAESVGSKEDVSNKLTTRRGVFIVQYRSSFLLRRPIDSGGPSTTLTANRTLISLTWRISTHITYLITP